MTRNVYINGIAEATICICTPNASADIDYAVEQFLWGQFGGPRTIIQTRAGGWDVFVSGMRLTVQVD